MNTSTQESQQTGLKQIDLYIGGRRQPAAGTGLRTLTRENRGRKSQTQAPRTSTPPCHQPLPR